MKIRTKDLKILCPLVKIKITLQLIKEENLKPSDLDISKDELIKYLAELFRFIKNHIKLYEKYESYINSITIVHDYLENKNISDSSIIEDKRNIIFYKKIMQYSKHYII